MENFDSFGLPEQLISALAKMNFLKPTPIQAQVIPMAIEGKDILGSAQTGTGKTGAFGIPIVMQLLNNPHSKALIMTPTRELAQQVENMIKLFLGKKCETIRTSLLIGGEDIRKQLRQLKSRPRIIVGTPGRIHDHIRRGSVDLSNVKHLVLDETDRMLDMGFAPQIEAIVEHIPSERQTLMFSATFPRNILSLASRYLIKPERVTIGEENAPAAKLIQEVVYISESNKHDELTKQLNERDGSIIVFVKTKHGAERITRKLQDEFFSADVIHGDLKHTKRERTLDSFRKEKYKIMVATDIAARGLDIAHVKHVINYDLPQCPEDYIHRIGRTARAGAEGSALCFVTPGEKRKWNVICDLVNKKFISKFTEHGNASNENRSPAEARGANSSFKPRDSFRSRDGERSFKPRDGERNRDSFRPRDGERSFKPRDGERSRDSFRPRDGERSAEFRPRDGERSTEFRPREIDGNRDSFRPRDGERNRDSFRSRDGERSFKPREGERSAEFRPRDGERSFKPRDGERNRDSFKPRDGERSRNGDAFGKSKRPSTGGAKSFGNKSSFSKSDRRPVRKNIT